MKYALILMWSCLNTKVVIVDTTETFDLDGFGDLATTMPQCNQPIGYLSDGFDCDDSDSTVYPGAVELCAGQTNECGTSLVSIDVDNDGDGYLECSVNVNGYNWYGIFLNII